MEWVPTPQWMLKALKVADSATYAIAKFEILVRKDAFSDPFMSVFEGHQITPAIQDIYAEHIHSINDYEGWFPMHERHSAMALQDAEMLIAE